MFQSVPCSMPELTWKFHENPFTCFSVILLTVKQTEQTDREDNLDRKWWYKTRDNIKESYKVFLITYVLVDVYQPFKPDGACPV